MGHESRTSQAAAGTGEGNAYIRMLSRAGGEWEGDNGLWVRNLPGDVHFPAAYFFFSGLVTDDDGNQVLPVGEDSETTTTTTTTYDHSLGDGKGKTWK